MYVYVCINQVDLDKEHFLLLLIDYYFIKWRRFKVISLWTLHVLVWLLRQYHNIPA